MAASSVAEKGCLKVRAIIAEKHPDLGKHYEQDSNLDQQTSSRFTQCFHVETFFSITEAKYSPIRLTLNQSQISLTKKDINKMEG